MKAISTESQGATAFLCLVFASILTGCGGGGGGAAGPALPGGTSGTPVSVTVVIGSNASSALRRTAANSAIESVKLVATSGALVSQAVSNCATTCSVSLQVNPGTVRFDGTLYDGQNGAGNALASATTTAPIAIGQMNQVNLVFTSASASTSPTPAPAGAAYPVAGWPQWTNANVFTQRLDALDPASHVATWSARAVNEYNANHGGIGTWTTYTPLAIGNANDGGIPVYVATAADPVHTIHCTASWGCPGLEGQSLHVPAGAVTQLNGSGDSHMILIAPDHVTVYELYQAANVGVNGNISSGTWYDTTTGANASGRGWSVAYHGAANAGQASFAAGLITAEDLLQGSINHALLLDGPCESGTVYPSTSAPDGPCATGNGAPMGGRLWLNMTDAQIDALGMPVTKTIVAKALAHYGAFLMDSEGAESWTVYRSAASAPSSEASAWNTVKSTLLGGGTEWLTDGWPAAVVNRFVFLDPCVTQSNC